MPLNASFNAPIAGLMGMCLLTGCASPFASFYEPAPHGSPVTRQATPFFEWSHDPDGDGKLLAREGYVLIGTSSFSAVTLADDAWFKAQAVTEGMRLGAAVVLLQADSTDVLADGCCLRLFASYWGAADRPAHM
ncbi:MAG TPA: hypothetical protein VGR86_04395 [Steroidobacteraceae bacterium]|nr:hypothetical protein [Steroidobacteraceae bacterium]